MANGVYEKLQRCTDAVREKISFQPEVALILGSGLGDYADEMKIVERIEYSEIEGFPVSTVAGHKGAVFIRICERYPDRGDAGKSALL